MRSGNGRWRRLVHPAPEAVRAEPFRTHPEFFVAADKVQVKYEMLRAHLVSGQTVTEAAVSHGYSRASFYLVQRALERAGMAGLVDERPGRRGPLKVSPEVLAFLEQRRKEPPPPRLPSWRTSSSRRSGCGFTAARWSGRCGGRERRGE